MLDDERLERQFGRCVDDVPDGWMGMDTGPESVEQFGEYIKKAATILWNGPVGVLTVYRVRGALPGIEALSEK